MLTRVEYLQQGIKFTSDDRNKEYGEPYDNLSACADLFTAYLRHKHNLQFSLSAEDVAILNVLQKIARTYKGQVKPDTYIDMATYSAIAGECALIAQSLYPTTVVK